MRGATDLNGLEANYEIWSNGEEDLTLPDGQTHSAISITIVWEAFGSVFSQSTAWYARGVGLVRTEDFDGDYNFYQSHELVSSTQLPGATAALPLAELVSADGDDAAFREDALRTGAHPDAALDPNTLGVSFWLDTEASYTASPLAANGLIYLADQTGKLAAVEQYAGIPRWKFTAVGPNGGTPAIADGVI
jgi:hypothetical protein